MQRKFDEIEYKKNYSNLDKMIEATKIENNNPKNRNSDTQDINIKSLINSNQIEN